MENQQTQELSPEQAQNEFGDSKAALAFSNMLREQQFMQDNPMQDEDASQEPQEGQGEELSIETGEEGEAPEAVQEGQEEEQGDPTIQLEGKMDEKMEILRDELKATIKTEIDAIREDIKNALENETD